MIPISGVGGIAQILGLSWVSADITQVKDSW